MNEHFGNQDDSEDENLFGIKKTTYWEIYGVKRFPYSGKRKFTPLLYPSFHGGMVISNDVFGLTISQFERIYKACLERRKTKEQWILNLRYPDKSSNDYLEYLQNCTDCNIGQLLCYENCPREKCLYEHLVHIVGTEIDIRKRQRLFIIQDRIYNSSCSKIRTRISSGSLAEGLDLPGSDMDIMYVVNNIKITKNVKNIKNPTHSDMFAMEIYFDHPGFAALRKVAAHNEVYLREECGRCPLGTCTGTQFYLPVKPFLDSVKEMFSYIDPCEHGPCISDPNQTIDIANCIRSKHLPHNAIPWAFRHRLQWPTNFVIDMIMQKGCLLVPIGPKTLSDNEFLWRISFSVAEKILVHSFNFTQFLCYGLLKVTLKCIVNTNSDVKELLCSYFLKTALFWVSEELDIDTFQLSKLYYCFSLCLDKLISWVNTCYCPNYFIPEHNMFIGKINQKNKHILLGVLESIKFGGIDGLVTSLFPSDNSRLASKNSEFPSIMLDFLFYRKPIKYHYPNWKSRMECTKYFLKSESSSFLIDVCTHHYAEISQYVAQLLPSPNAKGNTYTIRKCYHRHLQNGTKTDAVSGWLLYASFYYVIGEFNVSLKLTDYVLSRCSPDMMQEGDDECEVHRNCYIQNIHSTMNLIDRMKMATMAYVKYRWKSSLIPEELQLEVETRDLFLPPVVMSHCLNVLCYHHLGDIYNRQKSLRDLYLTVSHSIIPQTVISASKTVLGVCYEISGDKELAYQCYEEALQCGRDIFSSAVKRKSKLESN
ncbi:Hypothetical predicted protein [Mytilus galloprovincialis]|uniref:Mab-21-like HhH/H2TH-like domain-containing protein n=1 Tax=Mytilus galloprovincialis TaxID=29158 RepID=A0A8B6HUG6_MYTGA|nr:Hypothetical predicted protein [Mytilus galloprovincialis]